LEFELGLILRFERSSANLEARFASSACSTPFCSCWIKNANDHSVADLQALLPGLEFLRATGELNAIREITEEKQMYDAREKASLDIQSNLIDARREGEAIGRVKTYQELLGDRVSTNEELSQMSTDQLTSTIAELQRRLQTRNG